MNNKFDGVQKIPYRLVGRTKVISHSEQHRENSSNNLKKTIHRSSNEPWDHSKWSHVWINRNEGRENVEMEKQWEGRTVENLTSFPSVIYSSRVKKLDQTQAVQNRASWTLGHRVTSPPGIVGVK